MAQGNAGVLCNSAMMSSKYGHQLFGPYHFFELAKMKGYRNEYESTQDMY